MKYLLLLTLLFIGACGNTSKKDETSTVAIVSDDVQEQAIFTPISVPPLPKGIEKKIFFITNNSEFNTENYSALYYEPIYGTYYKSTLEKTNVSIEDLTLQKTDQAQLTYIFEKPVIEDKYVYAGQLSDTQWVYTLSRSVYIKTLTAFTPLYFSSYSGLQELDKKVFAVTNEFGYLYGDMYQGYTLYVDKAQDWHFNYAENDDTTGKYIRETFTPYVPLEMMENYPELSNVMTLIKNREKPYNYPDSNNHTTNSIPTFLELLLNEMPSYDKTDQELHLKAIAQAVEPFKEVILANFFALYSKTKESAIPTFLSLFPKERVQELILEDAPEYFMRTDTLSDDMEGITASLSYIPKEKMTDDLIEQLYADSLKNYDFWDCYAFEMPKFQALLKNDIPIPKDFTVVSYYDDEETGELKTFPLPVLHFLSAQNFPEAAELLLQKVPDYDTSVTNHKGLTISQVAISKGRVAMLELFLKNIPTLNVHELTPDNKTWLDLANELPMYNYRDHDHNVMDTYSDMRDKIINQLAPEHKIKQNITLNTLNTSTPLSLANLQLEHMKTNKKFEAIYPYQIEERHRFLFEQDITSDLDLRQFIQLREIAFYRYPKEVYTIYSRLIQFLVEVAKVDFMTLDTNGDNILATVVQTPHKDLFDFFIKKGLDPHHKNLKNENLWFYVFRPDISSEWTTYATFPELYAQPLIDLKVELNIINTDNATPYSEFMTGYYINTNWSEFMISNGADTNLGKTQETNSLE